MIELKDILKIGIVGKIHGKQGEFVCRMLNDYWNDADFIILHIDNIPVPFRVEDWRERDADSIIFRLKGIDNEIAASKLYGCEVFMLKNDIANNGEEEIMTWQDLIGYSVSANSHTIGVIKDIDETTINVLGILDSGKLIPLHEDLIIELDSDRQSINLNLPLGL